MKPLKVSEVNNYIKRIILEDILLSNIEVEGEISNYKKHHSGHLYFSLKDNSSRIRCIMFKSDAEFMQTELSEGKKIIAKGYISIYEKGGDYQLYVRDITDVGIGDLHKRYEELKSKLDKEGLFDEKYKKKLPFMPRRIGVVTSPTGAALRDIITVIKRRLPQCNILLFPALVQGPNAPKEIIKGLKYLDKREDIDLIIFGRGGGSIDELFAFNDEELARVIFSLNKPTISAVGHEIDFTISDFIADLRAPTPSAAAEIAVPNLPNLTDNLDSKFHRMYQLYRQLMDSNKQELIHLASSLRFNSPMATIKERNQYLDILFKDLYTSFKDILNNRLNDLNAIEKNLYLLDPLFSLDKGYGIILNTSGNSIKSVKELAMDETIRILMKDGTIRARIYQINKGESI